MISIDKMCVTCKYWDGDKSKALGEYDKNPISIRIKDGWPEDGRCDISYQWAEITILGNATVDFRIPAGFGCVFHSTSNSGKFEEFR